MFRNGLLLALVLAVVGASTTASVTNKKPTPKSTKEIRKSLQKAFHTVPRAKITEKKAALKNLDISKLEKKKAEKKTHAVAPSASLRGAAVSVLEDTQKVTNKAKLFTPNRGFLESVYYEAGTDCTVPTMAFGWAVNFCYYDAETNGAAADIVTFTKMPASAHYYTEEYYTTTNLVFSDPFCTATNTTASDAGYPNARGGPWCSWSNFKEDHVFEPTPVNAPGTVMIREYETEASCANDNVNELISYSTLTSEDFGCAEYFNENEYFKLVCVEGVPKAQVFPDADCVEELIREDDMSNTCGDQNTIYPFSIKCAPAPLPNP